MRFSRRKALAAFGAGALAACGPDFGSFGAPMGPGPIRAGDDNAPPGVNYEGPLYLSDVVVLTPGQTISADDAADRKSVV